MAEASKNDVSSELKSSASLREEVSSIVEAKGSVKTDSGLSGAASGAATCPTGEVKPVIKSPSGSNDSTSGCSFSTMKTCLHLVQRTFTPLSVTLESSSRNRVWHCWHWIIICDSSMMIDCGGNLRNYLKQR